MEQKTDDMTLVTSPLGPGTKTTKEIPFIHQLASHVAKCKDAAIWAKEPMDKRILDSLRRRKGEYDEGKLGAIRQLGSVETYMKHTGLKCRAAKAWIREVILPAGDKPWGMEPTPIPELPESVEQSIMEELERQVAMFAGETGMVPEMEDLDGVLGMRRDEYMGQLRFEAKKRCIRMETLCEDQFDEGGFSTAMEHFIDDLTTFPSAILKGPIIQQTKRLSYQNDLIVIDKAIIPCDRRISPLDFFPSPEMKDVNHGYILERQRITRREVDNMRGVPGYNDAAIEKVLKEYMRKGSPINAQLWDSERRDLENKENYQTTSGTSDDRIDIWEFWGSVPGQYLIDWGMHVKDPLREYEVMCQMVDATIIKAMLNPDPLGRRPYFVSSYEKIPDSIWGVSIPEIMAPVQDAMNAVVRAMLDNIAYASGPQVAVDVSRLDPRQRKSATRIWARKVWLVKSAPMGSTQMPIQFDQPRLIADALLRVLAKLEQMSDDQTGIPAYAYGNENVGGAGETASGLNMLMNAASKGIRQVIGNVGLDVIKPRVHAQYIWNMLYTNDPSIRGDANVNARGALAEIMKDQLKQERLQFLQNFIPPEVILGLLEQEGVAHLLRAVTDDLDVPGLVKREAQLNQPEQPEHGPAGPLPPGPEQAQLPPGPEQAQLPPAPEQPMEV